MAGIDLSFLSPVQTLASTLTDLVLVSPHRDNDYLPQRDSSYGEPIVFHYEKENNISLDSDITDHYIEDNTSIQDQVILKPENIKVRGVVGELNNSTPKELEKAKLLVEKLSILGAYLPGISAHAQAIYNQAEQLYNQAITIKDAGVDAWSSLARFQSTGELPDPPQTKQQSYFNLFYGYWRQRNLFSVQTPWAVFEDMAIDNLSITQEGGSSTVSEIEITFKKMRFAKTENSEGDINLASSRAQDQSSMEKYLGLQTPSPPVDPTITLNNSLQNILGKIS